MRARYGSDRASSHSIKGVKDHALPHSHRTLLPGPPPHPACCAITHIRFMKIEYSTAPDIAR